MLWLVSLNFTLRAEQILIPNEKVYVTNEGIFLNMRDFCLPVLTVTYIGNGIYAAEYWGQCGRCGWALDHTGKCTNRNCEQYGPRQD